MALESLEKPNNSIEPAHRLAGEPDREIAAQRALLQAFMASQVRLESSQCGKSSPSVPIQEQRGSDLPTSWQRLAENPGLT